MKNSTRSGVVVASGFTRSCVVGAIALAAAAPALAGGFTQVAGYRSKSDSPFNSSQLIVNDFEAGADTVGVSVVGVVARVAGTSVDADDASLDGAGAGGHSLALGAYLPVFAPGSATFSYQSKLLGGTPTNVGIVITSANGLEDLEGNPIDVPVTITVSLADGSTVSETFAVRSADADATDDVLLGYTSADGILALSVQAEIPIKIDHLQLGLPAQLTPPSVRNDFDGDGKADICWYKRSSSTVAIWKMDGTTRGESLAPTNVPTQGVVVLGSTDLNGDQRADIIWQKPSTGVVSAWLMDGGSVLESGALGAGIAGAWKFLGAGDIDGDGNGDCVFRHASTGEVQGWLMQGLTRLEIGSIGSSAGLTSLGMGDFDGDGKQDLLWRDNARRVVVWKLDGLSVASSQQVTNATSFGSSWRVAGTPDLDGDGRSDILWRNGGNGAISAWLMNGASRVGGGSITPNVSENWKIIGTSDFDGDGRDDILWRKGSSGDVYAWLMDGTTRTSSAFVLNVGGSWTPLK